MQNKLPNSHFLLTFLTFTFIISPTSQVSTSVNCNPTRTFIKSECNSTYFSNLCYTLLSPYACKIRINRQYLCEAALNTMMNTAENVLKLLVKLSKEDDIKTNKTEAAVISACVSDIVQAIDNINIASSNMRNKLVNETISRAVKQQVAIYTLYALADDKRCFERLSNGHIRDYLKKKIDAAISTSLKLKTITLRLVSRI